MATLAQILWPKGAKGPAVYALLDAARDESILGTLKGSDATWASLYNEPDATNLAAVAPYLVKLDPAGSFTTWLLAKGWGKSWGVFAQAGTDLATLRAGLAKMVTAQLPDKSTVLFRFYDPRVLRTYLPTIGSSDMDAVFPVSAYLMEAETTNRLLAFKRAGDTVAKSEIALQA